MTLRFDEPFLPTRFRATAMSTRQAPTRAGATGEGRVYYEKKIAEGKTSKEAIRALKRRISNLVYRRRRRRECQPTAGTGTFSVVPSAKWAVTVIGNP